jgi:cytidylate kinase
MSDKLQEIKDYLFRSTRIANEKELSYEKELIETIEQQKQEIEKWKRMYETDIESYECLKYVIEQMKAKMERYEKALKEIIAIDNESGSVGYLLDKAIKIAKQAVEVKG